MANLTGEVAPVSVLEAVPLPKEAVSVTTRCCPQAVLRMRAAACQRSLTPPHPLLPPLHPSWDRQPYQWDPAAPDNLYPALTTISRNFFVSNYHSTWPIGECCCGWLPQGGDSIHTGRRLQPLAGDSFSSPTPPHPPLPSFRPR